MHPVQKEPMTFVAPVPEEPLWQSIQQQSI
jgi:hypothetical protein